VRISARRGGAESTSSKPFAPTPKPTPSLVRSHKRFTLRIAGLHHIGIGKTYAGTSVLLLAHDNNIRIINAATGEILRELTLDPTRDYQGTGRPPGPPPNNKDARTCETQVQTSSMS